MNNWPSITLLLVDDNAGDANLIQELLSEIPQNNFTVKYVPRLSTALEYLQNFDIDIILLDLALPDSRGLHTFQQVQQQTPHLPIIILTGLNNEALAIEAVRQGAQDYLVKGDVEGKLLAQAMRYAIERKRAAEDLRRHAAEQTALYEVNAAVTASLEPDQLFNAVLDVLLSLWEADAGWITLPGTTPTMPLRIGATQGIPASVLQTELTQSIPKCPLYTPTKIEKKGQPLHSPTCTTTKTLARAGFKNQTCVPLLMGERVLGVLSIAWRTAPKDRELDHKLLLTIGRQIGIALHNAQLYQAAKQVDRLRVLNDLDQALTSTLEQNAVAEVTLNKIAAALDAPEGLLLLYDPATRINTGQSLSLTHGWVNLDLSKNELTQLHTFLRWLDEHPQTEPATMSEVENWPTTLGQHPQLQILQNQGLLIPVWGEGHLTALVALSPPTANHAFSEGDIALARAAASRAGQAIQNARLYYESQEKSIRLENLNAISAAAVAWLDADAVLHRILDLTCQALEAQKGAILLKAPQKDEVVYAWVVPEDKGRLQGQRLTFSQGIAGWVAKHRHPVLVNAPHHDDRFRARLASQLEDQSVMCAPLLHRDRLTGVIEVAHKTTGLFTSADLSLLKSVSSIAAMALENARLYTDTRARAEELELLNEIGLILTSTLNFNKVVQVALIHVQRLFQAESVSLLQPEPHTGQLHFIHTLEGTQSVPIPLKLHPGEGIAGWVFENRKAVLTSDAQMDARFSERVDQHTGKHTHALMAVPLITQHNIIGILEVISSKVDAYTYTELRTLQALASTLAVAIENAHLYDDLKSLLREREQAQEQLIHAEKMSALGRLLASIAHEINNPLQAIEGSLTLAQEEVHSGEFEAVLRYLSIAESEIQRISSIVLRLRDFYRPSRIKNSPTNLHSILDSVLELTARQLQHSQINVTRELTEDLPLIPAKADHLKQVFLNLVINAIDAMPDGGTLRVATILDELTIENEPIPAARIEFSDSGMGMDPDTISHLFEPFFTTKEQGSGLGLSISYGIIKDHHGEINVNSEIGTGTTFTIWLPVEPFAMEE